VTAHCGAASPKATFPTPQGPLDLGAQSVVLHTRELGQRNVGVRYDLAVPGNQGDPGRGRPGRAPGPQPGEWRPPARAPGGCARAGTARCAAPRAT
jgi:hypothetical protein